MVGSSVSIEAAPAAPAPDYPSLRQTWWPMLLLFLAANLYSIDKAIVGVLAEPIRTDFAISDVQMSLLLGLAYALLSGLLGLVLGFLIDRHIRRTILAASIILWSLSTVAGGLAADYSWFFVFRALVGLGEAALAPAAISLIADMFPPHRRGRALGAYLIGATVGSALSSIIPGWILGAQLHLAVPGFGLLVPWRTAFVLCGALGPMVGLLLLTVKEPLRRGVSGAANDQSALGEKLRYLWQRRRVMVPLYAGFCLHYVAFVGITSWTAAFLMRRYQVTLADFSGRFGLMLLLAGGAGYLAGGCLADTKPFRAAGGKRMLLAILPLVALPSTFAGFAPNIAIALILLAGLSFATPIVNVAMNATVQDLVPNRMRGFSYALVAVVSALPAGAGGPLAIAFATEHIVGSPALIGRSFLIVGVPALLTASCCFLLSRRASLLEPA
jgi:MFS family permease